MLTDKMIGEEFQKHFDEELSTGLTRRDSNDKILHPLLFHYFNAGFLACQSHLLDHCKESFEEWIKADKFNWLFYFSNYDHPRRVWQASRLSLIKEAASIEVVEANQPLLNQASLAAIEKLHSELEQLKLENEKLNRELNQQRFNNEHNLSIDQTVADRIKELEKKLEMEQNHSRELGELNLTYIKFQNELEAQNKVMKEALEKMERECRLISQCEERDTFASVTSREALKKCEEI